MRALLRWLTCWLVHSWDWQNGRWADNYRVILYRCPHCHADRTVFVYR